MRSLVFQLYTSSYLGDTDLARRIVGILEELPKEYHPTKAANSSGSSHPFSFSSPESFLRLVPGETPFEGDAELRKMKRVFEFGLQWQKGDQQWFASHPTKPFNCVVFEVGDGSIAGDPKRLAPLTGVFLRLADEAAAAYGYVHASGFTRTNSPDGFGRCLPRLHWMTYFGAPYTHAVNPLSIEAEEFSMESHGSGVLLRRNCSAEDAFERSDAEARAIKILGDRYFWNPCDNWRNPRGDYLIPELDWSQVVA